MQIQLNSWFISNQPEMRISNYHQQHATVGSILTQVIIKYEKQYLEIV